MNKTKSNTVKTITAKEFCTITGLSDRRHRQLAEAGYFPLPVRGCYDLSKAVSGIIRFYRERAHEDPLKEARLAKVESETELNRLTINERERKLVPVDELIPLLGKFLSAARARIDGDPKLERDEKDAIIEDLGKCLDAALGMQTPEPETEAGSKAQSQTTD